MNKLFLSTFATSLLIGGILVSGDVSATEEYDSKKFGPKSPIIMVSPTNVIFDHRVHTHPLHPWS